AGAHEWRDQVGWRVGVDLERTDRRADWDRGGRGRGAAGVVRSRAAGHDRCQRQPAAAARRSRCELSEGSPHERRGPRTDGEFCYPSSRIELLPIIPVAPGVGGTTTADNLETPTPDPSPQGGG